MNEYFLVLKWLLLVYSHCQTTAKHLTMFMRYDIFSSVTQTPETHKYVSVEISSIRFETFVLISWLVLYFSLYLLKLAVVCHSK